MIAWHYTTGQKYHLIKQSGLLLPAHIGVVPPELPILWFSTHPKYEPTARKPLGDGRGNIVRLLTVQEMYKLAGGLVRFGISTVALKRGDELRKAAEMSSTVWRQLEKTGKRQKANPADWFGHVGSIVLTQVTVEVMDTNMIWRRPHHLNSDAHLKCKAPVDQGVLTEISPGLVGFDALQQQLQETTIEPGISQEAA